MLLGIDLLVDRIILESCLIFKCDGSLELLNVNINLSSGDCSAASINKFIDFLTFSSSWLYS